MAQLNFALPPGIYSKGTERQATGRWHSGNLIRWLSGILRPVYGWVQHSTSTLTGAARAIQVWKDNTALSWIGIGTHSKLYIMNRAGTLYDVTPAALTVGRADATYGTGYGGGLFGGGTFGTPRPDTTAILDATVWTLDTFGQNLIGCNSDDTYIYTWVAPTTGTIAAKITNAPTANALVTTAERFIFALGANADPRSVAWCDQQNSTVWTPAATNQAGSFPLQTAGRIMCGRRLTGSTGLWTDADMWIATYIGGTLVYSFAKAGSGCGIISRQAVAVADSRCAWMGVNGFFVYDGYVQPIPCDVQDYVFGDLNRVQASKIHAFLNSQYGEVWWFYCSASSTEIDRAVAWSYRDNIWMTHNLARTAAADVNGAFTFPLMIDPTTATVYEHETGFSYGSAVPYAETGPVEFAANAFTNDGDGAKVWQASAFVPDEYLEGDVTVIFKARIFPNGPESTFGPYVLTPKTDVRFSGRQVKMRITAARTDDWRFGNARLDVDGEGDR